MKIYTRTGDLGQTSLFAGPRVPKNHARIEAFGTVDELNSMLGVARAERLPPAIDAVLADIQHELFDLGAMLATPDPSLLGANVITAAMIDRWEREIDAFEERLAPLHQFILPGGTRSAAVLHLARAVCRRAERAVVSLRQLEPVDDDLPLRYLNRLADLLFVLARAANAAAGTADMCWRK